MARGAVLEHGTGNGRIALPIARAGVEITGIDHCRPMLDHFRERLARESESVRQRVELVEGDIRTTRLGERFPLVICPFNAALHLYTREDVELWLARVREHLSPDGELVFDISMPVPKDLARDPSVPYRTAPFEHPTAGRVRYREHFDYDAARQVLFVSMFFEPVGQTTKKAGQRTKKAGAPAKTSRRAPSSSRAGPSKHVDASASARGVEAREFMTPLAHRQFFPCEMEALLHYNGFEVRALYGDFQRGPLSPRSDIMVWHARPRRSARTAPRRSR